MFCMFFIVSFYVFSVSFLLWTIVSEINLIMMMMMMNDEKIHEHEFGFA